MINRNLITLSALLQNFFLTNQPHFVKEVFGTFKNNGFGIENETWPDDWYRLEKDTLNDIPVYKISLENVLNNQTIFINYKLRLVLEDRSYMDTPWKVLVPDETEISLHKSRQEATHEDLNIRIPLIACTSINIIQIIIIIVCFAYIRLLRERYISLLK